MTAQVVLVVLGAAGAAVLVAAFGRRLPAGQPVFERSLRTGEAAESWPSQLVQLEHVLGWAATSAADVHVRLRPVLVDVAVARLARRGLTLDRHAAQAERLLGPDAWELVRPDRPSPRAPEGPGIGPGRLRTVLDALEAV